MNNLTIGIFYKKKNRNILIKIIKVKHNHQKKWNFYKINMNTNNKISMVKKEKSI